VLSACSSGSPHESGGPNDFAYPNGDPANTRHAGGSIATDSVSGLGPAWSIPITATGGGNGSYSASPVIAGGVVYSEDLDSKVQAIALAGGRVLWERDFESPNGGPNGLVAPKGGRVFGVTATDAFALDKRSGREAWSTRLVRRRGEVIHMAPGYRDGLVYASTAPGEYGGGEAGTLWALDARTGRKVWSFDTVPSGLWGHPSFNYGGGLTYTPAFDDAGSVYIGVDNAGPMPGIRTYPWASSRPGRDLYSDSVVKLDARTGRVQWHYQLTPHGLYNWDVGAPLLAEAGGRKLVVVAGLGGVVVALDRRTGKVAWRRPVGVHNGHGNDGLQAMRGGRSNLKTPFEVYPGDLGGVPAPLALSGSTVYVPVVNAATNFVGEEDTELGPLISSELVALDVATGAVEWQREFSGDPGLSSALLGSPTTVNDLVFAATFGGKLYALDAESGDEVWSTSLPAGFDGGIAIDGDTLVIPAGHAKADQTAKLLALRLSG
jgi:outer membrane protein assembly factor BamB